METLTNSQILGIKEKYSGIPQDYLDWLSLHGWGETESGYMVYSSPAYSHDLLGSWCPDNIKYVLLVADDMAGYSIGYINTGSEWMLVGIDSCDWEIENILEGFAGYFMS